MVYKLYDNPEGEYRDKSTGERKNLLEANVVTTPLGDNVGWTEFNTPEEALEYFNIELIVKPNEA